MMPNVPQYSVSVAAVLRVRATWWSTSTADTCASWSTSSRPAKAIIIIENFATTLQGCVANTPIKHVVLRYG